jgi:hypothetical protein
MCAGKKMLHNKILAMPFFFSLTPTIYLFLIGNTGEGYQIHK